MADLPTDGAVAIAHYSGSEITETPARVRGPIGSIFGDSDSKVNTSCATTLASVFPTTAAALAELALPTEQKQ